MNDPRALPRLTQLALAIQGGDWRAAMAIDPRCGVDGLPHYKTADWQSAAADALEGDASDLEFMLAREAEFQAFQRWQRAGARGLSERQFNPREDADFEIWREGEGRWARVKAGKFNCEGRG